MSYSAKCLIDEMSFRRNMFRRNAMDPITSNQSSEMEKNQVSSRHLRSMYALVKILLNILQNGENQSRE